MTTRLRPECITCLLNQNLKNYPADVPTDKKLEYMQRLLKLVAEAPKHTSAPVLVRSINAIQKEMFGYEKDFTEIKRYFNRLMLEKEEDIRQKLQQAEDPLLRAIQYAMTGNYIDFGTLNQVKEDDLDLFLSEVEANPVNEREYVALKRDLKDAGNILYITDNCGEIVLDKLLIEELKRQYPQAEVVVMVRGGAVLNDATMEDAKQVGLTEMVRVIDNGSNIAGTCIEELPTRAKVALDGADVIFSKGQANFETLRKCGKNVYYIFMCKCEMFAREFHVPKFTGMLVNDKNCV